MIIDSVGVRQNDDGYDGKKYTIYPDLIAKVRELNCGLLFKDEICWDKIRHGGKATAWGSYLSPASPNIRRKHEYVIVWQKGAGPLENITGQPSDLTKAEWMKSIYSVWQIPVEGKRYGNHPAPFPAELIRRLIRLYSFPGDLIVDPVNGTGTTTAVAASLGRRWLGIDLNPDYCKHALKRTGRRRKVVSRSSRCWGKSDPVRSGKAKRTPFLLARGPPLPLELWAWVPNHVPGGSKIRSVRRRNFWAEKNKPTGIGCHGHWCQAIVSS